MLRSGLKAEIWRCLGVLFICGLVGLIAGHFMLCIIFGALSYLLWLFYQIYRLEKWVYRFRNSNDTSSHDLGGLWSNISYNVQKVQAKHEKEKQRLQTVVQRVQEMGTALTDAVIIVDHRGNMEWWNVSAEQLFNFRSDDKGNKVTNLIRHPQFIQYFDQKNYREHLLMDRWHKGQHLELQVHFFGEGDRLIIARDITRVFKLEQMRKDFVANVSHELRTPLTVIRGYLETIADSPQLPKTWQKLVNQMEQQSERMTLLINDLITLSKLETDQKEKDTTPVMLAPLLDSIVNDARTLSGDRQHQFIVSGDVHLGLIGNERELRSALSNLIVNAVNYSPNNSTIEIHLSARNNGAWISVRDQGIGIDSKHIPRLTERFYRVDPSRAVTSGGTGLGLAIVKHILMRHNAELSIKSQVGRGSEFTCFFPPSMIVTSQPKASNEKER